MARVPEFEWRSFGGFSQHTHYFYMYGKYAGAVFCTGALGWQGVIANDGTDMLFPTVEEAKAYVEVTVKLCGSSLPSS